MMISIIILGYFRIYISIGQSFFQTEQFITETLLRELEIEKETANQRLLLTLLVALIALILCPAMTVIYLMHAQRLQRANRTFDQELRVRMKQINSQKQKSEQMLTCYMPKKVIEKFHFNLMQIFFPCPTICHFLNSNVLVNKFIRRCLIR
jgi:cell division protein FtsL